MIHGIMSFLYAIIGGVFRRYWGGWLDWPKYDEKALINKNRLKRAFGYILAFVLMYGVTLNLYVSLIACLFVGSVWWAIKNHAKSMTMGYGDWPLWKCAGNFILWYGGAMLITGASWAFLCNSAAGWVYAAFGLIVWVPHWIAQRFFAWVPEQPNAAIFIDARTAVGEVGLGAIVFGAMAWAKVLGM